MKIICIGKNYADHAKEMNSAVPETPVIFLKPDTSLLQKGTDFYYPDFTSNLHYETEIVLKIGKMGKHIDPKFALSYVSEISIGIDFTARDLQDRQKSKGLPWEIAKSFDNAAVVAPEFISVNNIPDLHQINFHLELNDQKVQEGNTNQMVFDIPTIISYISKFITLKTGDLIFTGTPVGVGPVKIGDELKLYIENKLMHSFRIK